MSDRENTTHPTIALYGTRHGHLLVGGSPIDRLARRVGSTPFFAYDRALITARVELLRECLPDGIELSYAVKANPMPAVVQHLSHLVDGFDVTSAHELRTALDTPISAGHVGFAGPGKTPDEIEQAIAAGVVIELESGTEADRVTAAAESLGLRPRVAVRVNPDFQVKGSGMRMGGGPQQFGVDAEQVPGMLKELGVRDLDVLGFHVFAGSQNLHEEILCESQRRTAELALALSDQASLELRYLNLGGGFGIPYFPGDEPLDLARVGDNLHSVEHDIVRAAFPDARLVVELGRYIVGEAGVYVTRVLDRKISRGQTYLVVDGGMHHQLAASGNLGQVIRRNYPVAIADRMDRVGDEKATIVGCLCTPLDVIAQNVILPDSEVGDLVAVFQAGAYGLTASPTSFLSHPTPIEVLV